MASRLYACGCVSWSGRWSVSVCLYESYFTPVKEVTLLASYLTPCETKWPRPGAYLHLPNKETSLHTMTRLLFLIHRNTCFNLNIYEKNMQIRLCVLIFLILLYNMYFDFVYILIEKSSKFKLIMKAKHIKVHEITQQ